MEWCMLASTLMSALALFISLAKKDLEYKAIPAFPLIFVAAIALFITGLALYEEPQRIKEQAVKIGVGKFVANDKGKVVFYFVRPDGSMVEYKNGGKI